MWYVLGVSSHRSCGAHSCSESPDPAERKAGHALWQPHNLVRQQKQLAYIAGAQQREACHKCLQAGHGTRDQAPRPARRINPAGASGLQDIPAAAPVPESLQQAARGCQDAVKLKLQGAFLERYSPAGQVRSLRGCFRCERGDWTQSGRAEVRGVTGCSWVEQRWLDALLRMHTLRCVGAGEVQPWQAAGEELTGLLSM